jgi:hypothetical protein
MFNYDNQYEQDKYISLQGLINKNNGFFKSEKHSKFVRRHEDIRSDADNVKKWYGIDMPAGTVLQSVSGYYRFASYGSRSVVPGLIFFAIDEYGVVAKNKVGGKGNGADGWRPDPAKCKVIWERPADAVLPTFDFTEKEDTRPALEEGRQKLVGTVKSTKTVPGYMGGITYKMLVELENGNRVYGTIPGSISGDVGNTVEFMAKVTPSEDDTHFGFFSRPTKASEVA